MKPALRFLLSLLLTAALLALLLAWSDTHPMDIARAIWRMDPVLYGAALATQLCIYPLRAARFRCLLAGQGETSPGLLPLVPVTMAHNLFAYLLPAKVGEASLVLYLKSGFGIDNARGMAVLLLARLLDLACVALFLCAACLALPAVGPMPEKLRTLGWILVPVCAALLVGLWMGPQLAHAALALARPILGRMGALGQKLLAFGERTEVALAEVSEGRLHRGLAWSLPIWLCVFLFYALLARGLGIGELGAGQLVFGAGLAILFGLLPLSTFAGFGSQDAGWVLGFVAVGVERGLAVETGLLSHLIYAGHIAVLGWLGHVWARRLAR
ncbi:MAG: lysylphosphatidylglycerol synthase transmembrane domain-containing protein [Planctomycetota bacterium]